MKHILLFFSLLLAWNGYAQEKKYSTFYYQRATLFEQLPVTPEDIVFLGNSITNGCEWSELFANPHIKNRGISGDIIAGVYDRLEAITGGKPAKIFLLIGINDLARGVPADTIVTRVVTIVKKIKEQTPGTRLYLQSLLPVTDHYKNFAGHTSRWQEIRTINAGLERLATEEKIAYIDLYSRFADEEGKMKIEYTNDGLHLLGKGYLLWREIVQPYIDETGH